MSENKEKKNGFVVTIKKASEKISDTAASVSGSIKDTTIHVRNEIEKKQEERRVAAAKKKQAEDLKKLSPIFEATLLTDPVEYERVIRIVNYDPRLENEVCKGAIGFYEVTKTRKIPTILSKYVHKLGLSFYPQLSESLYIADPCISGKYIEVDEYYKYMKQVRVNELVVIAQSLGAKHVSIQYTDSETAECEGTIRGDAKGMLVGDEVKGAAFKTSKNSKKGSVKIWADTTFKTSVWNGGPVMPTLLYFRNESDIASLIQMVLINKSKVTKHTFHLQASSSSGLTLSEAASIDASIKAIKCSVGGELKKEAARENKSALHYEIEF